MSLIRKPVFWVGIAAVGAIAWVATAPKEPEARPRSGSSVARKKSSPKKTTVQFTKQDADAKFNPLNVELKNAFQPIVIRKGGGFGNGDGAANVIPLDFTGGDSGWVYTGNAEIDGASTALLENRTTGEGVFLKTGERWKSAAVVRILSDAVVMTGPSGTKTFALVNEESPRMARGGYTPAGVNLPSNLRGSIGQGGGPGQSRGGFNGPAGGQAFEVLPEATAGNVVTIPSDGGAMLIAPRE